MSPSTEAGLAEKVAVVQKLAVLLPPVVILLKRIHHIQLTSRENDSRNQMDEKDSQITHHTIPTRARNPRNARTLGIRQRRVGTNDEGGNHNRQPITPGSQPFQSMISTESSFWIERYQPVTSKKQLRDA